jgi:[acyl-carrier-protein] S-malonyltransferase
MVTMISARFLKHQIESCAYAFRCYETENLGRSRELVDHPCYGPLVRDVLRGATREYAEATGQELDLVEYIREGGRDGVANLSNDNATIMAMRLAQLRILEEFFEVPVERARLSIGFSTGELTSLVFGKVFSAEQMLDVLVPLARDCAELADETRLGILLNRHSKLNPGRVEMACRTIRGEGRGLIGPTAYLSPRMVLIAGEEEPLARFGEIMHDYLPGDTILRRKQDRWTPLHSPLVWKSCLPNRIAVLLHRIRGPLRIPSPAVVSCVTGEASYDGLNARELLTSWSDHPQRLWDALKTTLGMGVRTIIHVGPASRLIATTFASLSDAVRSTWSGRLACRIAGSGIDGVQRAAGSARVLPAGLSLLRAPSLVHVILEDWLLANEPSRARAAARSRSCHI